MLFLLVARACQAIEQESSRVTITALLADIFAQASEEECRFLAYFFMGELAPSYHNKTINMGEKSVARAIALLLDVDGAQVSVAIKQRGDVGLFVREEMEARGMQACASLSVGDIAQSLQEVMDTTGIGSQEAKERMVTDLFLQLSSLEACFVARSIAGTLRLGFSDMTMLDAFSWMERGDKSLRPVLEHCYNVRADVGEVIATLKRAGIEGLKEATLVPGIPVRPAAAERLSDSGAVFEKLGPCVSQPKLDGFRLQVHIWTDVQGVRQMRFFSRNLHDMSQMFPDLVTACAGITAENAIFEGEAIVHDAVTGSFLPFQETVKRKRKHGVDQAASDLPLTLYIFDVLFMNSKSLLACSHETRRNAAFELSASVPEGSFVQVIEEEIIASAEQLRLCFEDAMSKGLEGIVVKKPHAHYQPGKRNFNWIKLKRQERGELVDTLDCVILGYYYGAGKRASFGIGAFLVGVFNATHDRFETIAKIGTGLSDDEWRAQKAACDALSLAEQPHNVVCAPTLVPDVWVHPRIVCMVRADDITRSPVHSAGKTTTHPGYALRFPRIMGYRPDKDSVQATTVKEVAHLYELQDLKIR